MHPHLAACAALALLTLLTPPLRAEGLQDVGLEPGYSLEIDKSERTLVVRKGQHVTRKFQVAVGRGGIGDKRIRGDNKTPLGVYRITEFKDDSGFDLGAVGDVVFGFHAKGSLLFSRMTMTHTVSRMSTR